MGWWVYVFLFIFQGGGVGGDVYLFLIVFLLRAFCRVFVCLCVCVCVFVCVCLCVCVCVCEHTNTWDQTDPEAAARNFMFCSRLISLLFHVLIQFQCTRYQSDPAEGFFFLVDICLIHLLSGFFRVAGKSSGFLVLVDCF